MRRVLTVVAVLFGAPALAAESWVEMKGTGFTFVSDGNEKDVKRVLSQFEQVRIVLHEAWPWAQLETSRPVTVLAVRDQAGFDRLVRTRGGDARQYAGVFVASLDRNWAALRMDVSRFQEGDDTWESPFQALLHDYVHLLLRHNFEQLPLWLEEGLCELWGNTAVEGDRVYVGRSVPAHVWTLRERAPMPLAQLFTMVRGSPEYSQDRATTFYAESWAFVHYLVVGSEARQGQLGRLLDLLRSGTPASEAATAAFGDMGRLAGEFDAYARRAAFGTRKRPAALERPPGFRELPVAESLAVRAAFLSAIGQESEARALAVEAVRAEPGIGPPYEATGLIEWRAGRRDEARQALERAVQLPGATDFAHDLYGHLLWETLPGKAGLDRVQSEFERALQMNAGFAKAYESLALVKEAAGAPADQTLGLAERAVSIEPGNLGFRLTALRIMGRAGQVQAARAGAEKLLASVQGEDRKKVEAVVAELADPKRMPPDVACAAGFGVACHALGAQYRDGSGVAKDTAKAAAFFQKGCDAGHAGSCSSLGMTFEDGAGVAKDVSKAIALYRKGCEGGDRWSCTRLAFALAAGDGVAADPAEAARLLDKTCVAGDVMACAKLGSMLRTGEGVPEDMKRAESLLRGACDKKSSWGCGELASLLVARGTPQDLGDAAKLLEVACETDAPSFCAMLAGVLDLGVGVTRDDARATALYKKACDGGYALACGKVGR